jgi:phosphatidylglycerol lysyltransferase
MSEIAVTPPSPGSGPATRRGLAQRLAPLLSLGLLAIAAVVLWREFAVVTPAAIGRAIQAWGPARIGYALLLTVLSYGLLTCNEWMGLRWAGKPLPYRIAAIASFTAYAFAHNLGLNLVTGTSLRWRIYSARGLTLPDVLKVTAYCATSFGMGMATLAGLALTLEPDAALRMLGVPLWLLRAAGVGALAAPTVYLAATAFLRDSVTLFGHTLALPRLQDALAQVVIGAVDNLASAALVYVLTPAGVGFGAFAGAYVTATTAGLISSLPGGVGVFESVMATLLREVPRDGLAAALLGYRLFYYALVLVCAASVLALYESREGVSRFGQALGKTRAAVAPAIAPISAVIVAAGGAVLLASGATPMEIDRISVLRAFVPLPLVEAAHAVASLTGLALLVLATGLWRRLDGAWRLSIALMIGGALFSLLKGFDWEEALVLSGATGLLWVARPAFYRRSRLIDQRFSPIWYLAVSLVIAASIGVGLAAYRDVPYSDALWTRFGFHDDASRFLRATAAMLMVIVGVGLWLLTRPARIDPAPVSPAELDRAQALLATAPQSEGALALLGDKRLIFAEDGRAFLMVGVQGESWIVMGGPIGEGTAGENLLWDLKAEADTHAASLVIYQAPPELLPVCADLGLALLKLGEEARVSLPGLSFAGGARRNVRQTHSKAAREGLSFEIAPASAVAALLPTLRALSDAWLQRHSGVEKGFSLGFFDEDYLTRFDCALVRFEGRIVAFANIWTAAREEASVDLMRFAPDAPRGVMDFLFVELLRWASGQGFAWFNLGMAPLSGLSRHRLAPLWHKLGGMLFRTTLGDYNFEGLRSFKEKFAPEWRPRYLACPPGLSAARALLDVTRLIARGPAGKRA